MTKNIIMSWNSLKRLSKIALNHVLYSFDLYCGNDQTYKFQLFFCMYELYTSLKLMNLTSNWTWTLHREVNHWFNQCVNNLLNFYNKNYEKLLQRWFRPKCRFVLIRYKIGQLRCTNNQMHYDWAKKPWPALWVFTVYIHHISLSL